MTNAHAFLCMAISLLGTGNSNSQDKRRNVLSLWLPNVSTNSPNHSPIYLLDSAVSVLLEESDVHVQACTVILFYPLCRFMVTKRYTVLNVAHILFALCTVVLP